jgi:dephospho-CoA kinase
MYIGIAGKIASGKSTLARAVAPRLNARRLGFGDYVRSIARAQGLDASNRSVLQELGQGLATCNPSAFVGGLLSRAVCNPSEDVVIDGIRHVAIWQEIGVVAAKTGGAALLVFLDMPEATRQERLAARGLDRQTADGFDEHASESELEYRLREIADLILDARLNEAQLVDRVVQFAKGC